jgi:hypothetical protein
LQIDLRALLVKTLPKADPAKKQQQDSINVLVEERSKLDAIIEQQRRETTSIKQERDKLRRRLTAVYEDQLSKLRTDVANNTILQKQSLTSYKDEITKIRQYQNDYWDKIDDSALVDKELKESTKTYRGFGQQLEKLEQQLGEATTAYELFQKAAQSLNTYRLDLSDTTGTGEKAYNTQLTNIQRTTSVLVEKIDTVRNSLTAYNQRVKSWENAFKAKQEKNASNDNITALPALTSVKGASLYIPAVSVIGSHRGGSDDSPNIYSIKLFTALGSTDKTDDVPSKCGTERLFIPDASTFGFSADAAFAFNYAGKKSPVLGVVIGASYLDKLMTPDSLHTFTTGVATARVSLEWYVIPNALMLYGGVNSLTFLTNRDQVIEHYTTTRPKDMYGFTNAGVRAILNLSKDNNISFLFDLGFVLKGDNVKSFVPNDDLTITTIRVTLAKNFALR